MTSDKWALVCLGLGTTLWLWGVLWAYIRARSQLKQVRFRMAEVVRRRTRARDTGTEATYTDLSDVIGTWGDALLQKGQLREAVLSESLKAIGTLPGLTIIAGVMLQTVSAAIPLVLAMQGSR